MGRHDDTRMRRSIRWTTIVAGTVTALLAAPLTPPAQAGPFDPNEVWAQVFDEATFEPLAGATVTLFDDAGTELDTAVTDAAGDAGFTGLVAATTTWVPPLPGTSRSSMRTAPISREPFR